MAVQQQCYYPEFQMNLIETMHRISCFVQLESYLNGLENE